MIVETSGRSFTIFSSVAKYFHDLVQYIQYKPPPPFLSLEYVLSMFINFGHFSVSHSYEKGSSAKRKVSVFMQFPASKIIYPPISSVLQ